MSSSSPLTAMAGGSKKKKKKRGVNESDPTAKLTDDLLVEVISRVPYKSTCSCKCVSTRWRDLFTHPDHRKNLPQSLVGFFSESYREDRFPRKARLFTNVSNPFDDPFIDPSLSFLPNYESLDIVGSCNGLLLCRCWKATDPKKLDYIVCNPATEKWVVVPATDWSCEMSCKVSAAHLGFDPSVSSHFHVFEFIDQETWGRDEDDDELIRVADDEIVALAIYSSKTGAWKFQTVQFSPFVMHHKGSTSVFLNGILHLAVHENLVVAVDVEGDNWWHVEIPMTTPDVRTGDVFLSQGRLHFANSTVADAVDSPDTELDVWVLEDYDTSEWTLKHNVSHLQLLGRKYLSHEEYYRVISIHPEHNLVFIVCADENALLSYDMDSGARQARAPRPLLPLRAVLPPLSHRRLLSTLIIVGHPPGTFFWDSSPALEVQQRRRCSSSRHGRICPCSAEGVAAVMADT